MTDIRTMIMPRIVTEGFKSTKRWAIVAIAISSLSLLVAIAALVIAVL